MRAFVKRRRYKTFNHFELVRMFDGFFYTRKTLMPVARYLDDVHKGMFPASLNYEYSRRFLKKDVLQNFVFQTSTENKAKTDKLLAVQASRTARYSRRFKR